MANDENRCHGCERRTSSAQRMELCRAALTAHALSPWACCVGKRAAVYLLTVAEDAAATLVHLLSVFECRRCVTRTLCWCRTPTSDTDGSLLTESFRSSYVSFQEYLEQGKAG